MVAVTQKAVTVQDDAEGKRIQRVFTNFLSGYVLSSYNLTYPFCLDSPMKMVRLSTNESYWLCRKWNATRSTSIIRTSPNLAVCWATLSSCNSTGNYTLSTLNSNLVFGFYPFLVEAVRSLAAEKCGEEETIRKQLERKEIYISFLNLPSKRPIRELTMDKIGVLVRISGQVVRTHPVHPELFRGTFVCEDCGVSIRNVQQQFKYTLVSYSIHCYFNYSFLAD